MFGGTGVVDVVNICVVFEVAALEADEDFVAPGPNAVVGGPASEASALLVNDRVFDVGGAQLLGAGGSGEQS